MTHQRELIEVALRWMRSVGRRRGTGEVDPAWASFDVAFVVGTAAVGGLSGGVVGFSGG